MDLTGTVVKFLGRSQLGNVFLVRKHGGREKFEAHECYLEKVETYNRNWK